MAPDPSDSSITARTSGPYRLIASASAAVIRGFPRIRSNSSSLNAIGNCWTLNESAPAWSADGGTVFFRRGDNAWSLDLARGRLAQLTDIRPGPAPEAPKEPEGQRRVLRDQQRELFDAVRR